MNARKQGLVIFCCSLGILLLLLLYTFYRRTGLALYQPDALFCTVGSEGSSHMYAPYTSTSLAKLIHYIVQGRTFATTSLFSGSIGGEMIDESLSGTTLLFPALEITSSSLRDTHGSGGYFSAIALSGGRLVSYSSGSSSAISGHVHLSADVLGSGADLYFLLRDISLLPTSSLSSLVSGWYTILRLWSTRWIYLPAHTFNSLERLDTLTSSFCVHMRMGHPRISLTSVSLNTGTFPVLSFSGIQNVSLDGLYPEGTIQAEARITHAFTISQITKRSFAAPIIVPEITHALDIQDIIATIQKQSPAMDTATDDMGEPGGSGSEGE